MKESVSNDTAEVVLRRDDRVATITLDRPAEQNRLDTLRHAFEWSHDVDEGASAHREGRTPRLTGH
jgi:hypothetical protein